MGVKDFSAPVDRRAEFPWEYNAMDNGYIPHAGGGNGHIALNETNYDRVNEDPELADLDNIEDYDSIVVRDARVVSVTEVRMVGYTLVPVNRTDSTTESSSSKKEQNGESSGSH